jgi:hypothetical protein
MGPPHLPIRHGMKCRDIPSVLNRLIGVIGLNLLIGGLYRSYGIMYLEIIPKRPRLPNGDFRMVDGVSCVLECHDLELTV